MVRKRDSLGVLAELERSLITERTRAGISAARKRWVKFGRKPKLNAEQLEHAREMLDQGKDRQHVARILKMAAPPFTGPWRKKSRLSARVWSPRREKRCGESMAGTMFFTKTLFRTAKGRQPQTWLNSIIEMDRFCE